MTATQQPEPTLKELRLSDLEVVTKDLLLALHSSTGKPIRELVADILNHQADITLKGGAKRTA